MHYGCIGQEFYIGRYLYLSKELERLPNITFGSRTGLTIIRLVIVDPASGKKKYKRISPKNPKWEAYKKLASRKARLEEQLNCLLTSWKEDYGGSLEQVASEYQIIGQPPSLYNCALWESFTSNADPWEPAYPVQYKDFVMRSYFEVEVAKVLDFIGLDYKYEVKLVLGDKYYFPDMAVNLPEYDRCGFVEAMGGMDSLKYVSHNMEKLNKYINYGIYPNRDVSIVPGERSYFPDRILIKRIVGNMLTAIAKQYVVKKS